MSTISRTGPKRQQMRVEKPPNDPNDWLSESGRKTERPSPLYGANDWMSTGSNRDSGPLLQDETDHAINRDVLRLETAGSRRTEVAQANRVALPLRPSPTPADTPDLPVSTRILESVLDRMGRLDHPSVLEVSAAARELQALKAKADWRPGQQGKRGETEAEEASLREQVKRKDRLITDYQIRLKTLRASSDLVIQGLSVEDFAPAGEIVDNFTDLFGLEWRYAHEALKSTWTEERRIASVLFTVVRDAYIFCTEQVKHQRTTFTDLSALMKEAMIRPTYIHRETNSKYKYNLAGEGTPELARTASQAAQLLDDYQTLMCSQTIPGIQELFLDIKLPEIVPSEGLSNSVRDFAKRVVQLTWLMVVHVPPILFAWLEPNAAVRKEQYEFYQKRIGKRVQTTVWPAVFKSEGGELLKKGVVMAV
ncbi:uncharacterized protein LOC128227494 isoform X2 [Mya arenaria]|uniref:uncharacterized protein LOC128227494 isoform X2 n=1 Tax=Mya arenaria TaxID=6604 RepID=UPI0022E2605B|nr:uncharacterized protein LOC128227494 isoform X2 [Mya arenaria]